MCTWLCFCPHFCFESDLRTQMSHHGREFIGTSVSQLSPHIDHSAGAHDILESAIIVYILWKTRTVASIDRVSSFVSASITGQKVMTFEILASVLLSVVFRARSFCGHLSCSGSPLSKCQSPPLWSIHRQRQSNDPSLPLSRDRSTRHAYFIYDYPFLSILLLSCRRFCIQAIKDISLDPGARSCSHRSTTSSDTSSLGVLCMISAKRASRFRLRRLSTLSPSSSVDQVC